LFVRVAPLLATRSVMLIGKQSDQSEWVTQREDVNARCKHSCLATTTSFLALILATMSSSSCGHRSDKLHKTDGLGQGHIICSQSVITVIGDTIHKIGSQSRDRFRQFTKCRQHLKRIKKWLPSVSIQFIDGSKDTDIPTR
jgi:hypothetical protein